MGQGFKATQKDRICSGLEQHVNKNVQGNQKYCKECREELVAPEENVDETTAANPSKIRKCGTKDDNKPMEVGSLENADKSFTC